MNVTRAHVWISGRVQGVFFRTYTQEEATKLGLTGWVRNLSDGRVEAVFEGNPQAIKQIIKWCHHGPSTARVAQVDVNWEQPTQDLNRFETRQE